jgi:hypothetical protein
VLHDFQPSPILLGWSNKVSEIGGACGIYVGKKNACMIVLWKHERKGPFGRSRCTWQKNIKLDLKDIGWEGVDLINLAQEGNKAWAVMNTVMNIRFPYNWGISWLTEELLACQEGLWSVQLVGWLISELVSYLVNFQKFVINIYTFTAKGTVS